MQSQKFFPEQISVFKFLFRWTLLVIPLSALTGALVALFLWLLDLVTQFRWQHPWLLYLLPLAGVLIYWMYRTAGKNAEKGNNLIIDEIHEPGGGPPLRMAPLVLAGTIITHLFGGSAGREGTAVQMGGSMAGWWLRALKIDANETRVMLMAGIAAGFGAVFGTPVAGAVFALEVLTLGSVSYAALLPCFIAAVLADQVCKSLGAHHVTYEVLFRESANFHFSFLHIDPLLLLKIIAAVICFGLAGWLFAWSAHSVNEYSKKIIRKAWLIPVVGGLLVIALSLALRTNDYLGLGVSNPDPNGVSILSSFQAGGAGYFSWFWKIVFTVLTIGMGFKGGEVTPLFFIGATLGNAIAGLTGAPVDLMAALGFVAVFAAATNTPIACTLMAVELFGGGHVLYYAVACFTAYYFSGHTSIYKAQRIGNSKIFTQSVSRKDAN